MKTTIGVIILAVVCVGLAVALLSSRNQVTGQRNTMLDFSNRWETVSGQLQEQVQVNTLLTNDLDARRKAMGALTNQLLEASANLARTDASLKSAQADVAKRDAKIAELESQNRELDQRAVELSTSITNLNAQIEETKRKLAASEGDKAFLEKELQRMITEKAELERQFNDLKALRAQVAKLKEEMNVSRRLEWIRKGLFATSDQRGAQQLLLGGPAASAAGQTNAPRYDLNVEVSADGSVRVLPPATNRPAATPPPR